MTPLAWCMVISTTANVAVAAMVGWFFLASPTVQVRGSVGVHGSVKVDGGTIEATNADKDAIQKVQICEQTSELPTSPTIAPFGTKPGPRRVIHCASIDQASQLGGIRSFGLSAVPARNQ